MNAWAELLNLGHIWLWHGLLIFLRVGALVSLMPGFGEQSVPVRVKLGLAIAVTLAIAPMIPPFSTSPWSFAELLRFGATETVSGLLFGIGLRFFVMALQTAGTIAAQSTSLSQILGASAEPMPAIGHLLVISGLALAMATGLHVKILAYLVQSYDLLPAGRFPAATIVAEWGVAQVTQSFVLAFRLAAPFVIVSLLYNLALGAINRAMPQLMVAFVGAPAITAGGLILLALLVPTILWAWLEAMQSYLNNPGAAG